MTQFHCDAILFDLDGVLVDSTALIEHHWNLWAKRHGLNLQEILAISHGRRSIDTIQMIAPFLSAESEARLLEDAEEKDTEGLVALPGVARLLNTLDPQRWAVVTSGTPNIATNRLRATGLPLPAILVTAHDVTHGKPDPEGYLKAANLLGIPAHKCLVIEDAPAGIQAAHAAHMQAIAVSTTHAPEALQVAEACIPSLEALNISKSSASTIMITLTEHCGSSKY
ncbi:HAD family hydrolase [Ktedonosporobacter rubrisoli]|uniref:HAD family hydrolase n=1 Tax=Ktedonosporobacter rubrisoli TaxID=2509675 RepID=A0A4P6K162_KTERU|nr:HAD family hydrolase [Ktedonosporobacter rubrisoli]QBD81715.1 HAD family hydrolase [Ktedonosporobacter rubrisoli]